MPDTLSQQLQTSLGDAYLIERELGGGGMSRVFLATEQSLGRQIVIKLLPPEMAAAVSTERFKREIQLAARLQHPHIVPLLAAGDANGLPYFTMPFVQGESLRVRLARHGELPVAEAVRVLREIASALAYAQENGVVHRDIKPDNVLLSGGAAMVTDFGVAKALSQSSNSDHGGMTSLGVALGTPAYMAPEQASADPAVDHRADVYAFGILAYELLTGQTPFGGRTPQGLLAAHVTESPELIQKRRASLPSGLGALVMRCLEKRPADRPQTAAEIVHALDDLTTPSGGMPPTSAASRAQSGATPTAPGGRRRAMMVAAGAVALIALAGGVWAKRGSLAAGSASGTAGAAASAPQSIAVLPLENAGADTSMQFFADGMTDELTSSVANIPGLQVASRSATSAALKAASGDPKVAGGRLAVSAVLSGRIRRSGDRMRLTAELMNVANGLIVWTSTYDRQVKDAFQVQDEVARAIASALRLKLGGAEQLASPSTKSPEAHDLYLRGRYVQAKYTEPDLRKSLELFQQALAIDSSYAEVWAGISDTWGMLADDYLAPREALPPTREAIARAMAIDSTGPELRFTRGTMAYFYEWDLPEAERLMTAALRQLPSIPLSTRYYAGVLWSLGLRDSAAAFVRQAAARDPTNPDVLREATFYFLDAGDLSSARQSCNRLTELRAGDSCSAQLDIQDGKPDAAIARFAPAANSSDARTSLGARRILAQAYVKAGRMNDARALAMKTDADARSSKRYVREDGMAQLWATAGDNTRAMEWMERAASSRSAGVGNLYVLFANSPLRHDPRLLAFAKKHGLPDPPAYWR